MSFRYPLQKIVDLKSNEKTQAEWMLSQTMGILRDEEHSLDSLHSEKNELHSHLNSAVEVSVNISQLRNFQSYIDHLDTRIVQKKIDVQQAQQEVIHKKEHLSFRMIDEKVWTNVKEKAKEVFNKLEQTKEQKILDEIATNRHKHSF